MSFRRRAAILAALSVVLMATLLLAVLRSPRRRAAQGAGIPLAAAGTIDRASGITLSGRDTIRLQRDADGTWWVRNAERLLPARQSRVQQFLSQLADSSTSRRVTTRAELWPDFGLDHNSAQRVLLEAADGELLADVVYGRRTESGAEAFVRFGAADEVYAADAAGLFYLERESIYWTELRLFGSTLSVDSIEQLAVWADIGDLGGLPHRFSYRLQRGSDASWRLADERGEMAARAGRVRELLAAVVSLEGARVAAATPPADAAPSAEVTAELVDGSRYRLEVYGEAGAEQFTVVASGPAVPLDANREPIFYLINDWTLGRVLRLPRDILE